jgi:hypothetical protein
LFDNNVPSIGGSKLYVDDTGGLSSWTTDSNTPAGQKWITDFQIKNTTIDSNTFLMCDSGYNSNSTVIRSTNGVNFTSITFGDMFAYNRPYKALNLSNTSTWYIAGTTIGASNQVAFYTSLDDGLTWSRTTTLPIEPRQSPDIANYYTYQGVAFGYSSNVFKIGGRSMMRSSDAGSNWSGVVGGFETEVGNFSMDGPVWVATGSDRYISGSNYYASFASSSPTLKWSSDQGVSWSNATGSVCSFIGYEVAYASNTWLSTGMNFDGGSSLVSKLLTSTDGIAWSDVTLDASLSFTPFNDTHLPEVGSLWFDGSNWNVIVKMDNVGTSDYGCSIYTHDLSSSLTTGWTKRVAVVNSFGDAGQQPRGFWQQYVRTGTPTLSTFAFTSFPTGGPVITSPTTTSFTFYQYVTIDPITISATGTGFIYYFVDNATLPVGLAFDPLTGRITGQSVEIGQKSFTIYMKDDIGATFLTINTNTIIPRVIRQQTGAGAWTSLVRQYTVVNAAQNSVNGHVLPSTEATLGEFTRPEPPDSVSATGNPNCAKTC